MTKIEAHYREVTIRERIQSLHGELLVIADSVNDERHLNAIERACIHLEKAADALRNAPPLLDLKTQLELSICTVKEGRKNG